jgi:putative inorganic carbon (hco3(-)) transporter
MKYLCHEYHETMKIMMSRYLPPSLTHPSETVAFLGLAGCVAFGMVSIAASQIMLAVAYVGFFWMLKRGGIRRGGIRRSPVIPALWPLLAFMAWILLVVFISPDTAKGLAITKKFYLLFLVAIVPFIVHGEGKLAWIYRAVFLFAIASATCGLLQYIANPNRNLMDRISGFMGHWMTLAGLLMLVFMMLSAYALFLGIKKHAWVLPAAGIIISALLLSQTRNAWMGLAAGIIALILLRRPRILFFSPLVLLLFFVAAPEMVQQRILTGLDPTDPNTRNRIELFTTAIAMVKDNPVFGVGPKNVGEAALQYRSSRDFPDWMYQHMHNNFLQVASETGIPGLILWIWFMFRLAWDALTCHRHAAGPSPPAGARFRQEALMASAAALSAWVALMTAGMFEYNFGDSEVLTLFLFIMTAPYAFTGRYENLSNA